MNPGEVGRVHATGSDPSARVREFKILRRRRPRDRRRRSRPRQPCAAAPLAPPRRDEPIGGRLAGRRDVYAGVEIDFCSAEVRSSAAAVARRRPKLVGRRCSPGDGGGPVGARRPEEL